jgi:hypothetical protein
MIVKRRLLDALTSRTLKRWLSQASAIAPGGIEASSCRIGMLTGAERSSFPLPSY